MLISLVGKPKTGKTVSACTFPKPIIYFDWDDGLLSAKTTKDSKGKRIISDEDLKEIRQVKLIREEVVDLNFSTNVGVKLAPKYTKGSSNLIKIYNEEIDKLSPFSSACNIKYQTLVIDSLSSMFRVWKEATLKVNNISTLRIQDYLTLESALFSQFIPGLKTLQKHIPYIVLINHEMSERDEITGAVSEFSVGPSMNQGKLIGKEFDELYRQTIEKGEYIWRTKQDGLFIAGSRLGVLDKSPAHFQSIKPLLSNKE